MSFLLEDGKKTKKIGQNTEEKKYIPRKRKITPRYIPFDSISIILKETEKRYRKFGYNGYLGHVEIIKKWLELEKNGKKNM